MTPLYPDSCGHGKEAYICTMYDKDIYVLRAEAAICIRHGKENIQYISADTSQIVKILHRNNSVRCYQLKELVRKIVQQGAKNGEEAG